MLEIQFSILEISIFINQSLTIIYGNENSATLTQANVDALT